jgi:anti-sigma regulatory factor (Ser/Thr protein kinase)
VIIRYGERFYADNIVKASLCSTIEFLRQYTGKKFWVPRRFNEQVRGTISRNKGEEFSKKTIEDMIFADKLNYYVFNHGKGTSKAVRNICDLLVKKSLGIRQAENREFLSTVIGEIFANSTMHSEKQEVVLIFDVVSVQKRLYLEVSICDYGKTILENVKEYFEREGNKPLNGCGSMEWAMGYGATTRQGSGGYGLPTMLDYVKKINGSLYIISGNAACLLENNERHIQEIDGYWQGTNVVFCVPLINLTGGPEYNVLKGKIYTKRLNEI